MNVFDLDHAPLSDRNGSYGGAAGSKEGILIDGQYWIVKYPRSTRSMRGDLASYTSSPLSEYIGSHIYSILGYPVHETILGIRNNKLVVGCKDFCSYPGELREMRTLKNTYNETLEALLETEISSTGSAHSVELRETLLQLDYNPILASVAGLKERFWDCTLIDGLINNNDRNNGNWGLLYQNNAYRLAPVFDNGAAFSNKVPDDRLAGRLNDPQKMEASALNTILIYARDGKNYTFPKFITECLQYPDFRAAIRRTVPLIQKNMPKIRKFMAQIPESYRGISVCSSARRTVYLRDMELRLDKLLTPALEKVIELEKQKQKTSQQPVLEQRIAEATAHATELNAVKDLERRSTQKTEISPEHS